MSSIENYVENQVKQEYENFNFAQNIVCGYKDEEIVLICLSDIYYLEILDRKVLIHSMNGVFESNKSLKFYEEKTKNSSFFRTHKSFIVNLEKVDRFLPRINYTYDLYFKDIEDVIPLSRSKLKVLKLLLNA